MNYAVLESGGKQYIASLGKVISIDKIDTPVGGKITFTNVLLIRTDDKVQVGTPFINGSKVTGKVIKQYKGDKIDVIKFKAKVRYRRKIGFRPMLTDVKIEKIFVDKKIPLKREKSA